MKRPTEFSKKWAVNKKETMWCDETGILGFTHGSATMGSDTKVRSIGSFSIDRLKEIIKIADRRDGAYLHLFVNKQDWLVPGCVEIGKDRLWIAPRHNRVKPSDFFITRKKKKHIKNPHKIHFIERDGKYACIKAVTPTKEKSTRIKKKVTCKNCLRKVGLK